MSNEILRDPAHTRTYNEGVLEGLTLAVRALCSLCGHDVTLVPPGGDSTIWRHNSESFGSYRYPCPADPVHTEIAKRKGTDAA